MRKLLASVALGGMLLGSGVVSAEEITGLIENMGQGDQGPTFTIDGTDFVADESAAATLSDLKAGDQVRAIYSEGDEGVNFVSTIEKVE
ncbi:MAG: hypothetical protein AAFY56_16040 [Pseudomonadota bacterium]